MRLAALPLLLVLAVPGAAAELTVTAVAESRQLVPEAETLPVDVTVTVDCNTLLAAMAPGQQAVVELAYATIPSVIVAGPQAIALDPQDCIGAPGSTATANTTWTVAVTRTTPGLVAIPVQVNASLTPSPRTGPPVQGHTSFDVMAGPYLLVQPILARRLVLVEGDEGRIDVELRSFGNVRTQVDAALGSAPATGRVLLPDPVILGTPGQDNGEPLEVVQVRFRGEGLWQQAAVQVILTPKAADQPSSAGDPLSLTMLFRNGSAAAKALPGPPALALLGAALMGALLARRQA